MPGSSKAATTTKGPALQRRAYLVQGMEGKRLTYWELTSSPSLEASSR